MVTNFSGWWDTAMQFCKMLWQINYNLFHIARTMSTKLSSVVTFLERLPPLNSLDPLMTCPTWGHLKNWKNWNLHYLKIYDRVLTSEKRFKTQISKSSPVFVFCSCWCFRNRLGIVLLPMFCHLFPRKHVSKVELFSLDTLTTILIIVVFIVNIL